MPFASSSAADLGASDGAALQEEAEDAGIAFQELRDALQHKLIPTCSLKDFAVKGARVRPELDTLLMGKECLNIKPMQIDYLFFFN